jgi:hypothetical protein
MNRIIAGLALVASTGVAGSAQAFCVYADRQYSTGATLCISPIATQTCTGDGSWTKLELPQTQPNSCDRAYQSQNFITFGGVPDRRRDN